MDDPNARTDDALTGEHMRARIVEAAAHLIASGGRDAATTRAIASAAGVQAPAIYRLFGDKRGLLDAVAEHGLVAYVARKSARKPNPDPVEELREGWDLHVAFGLAHPGLFAILNGDPHPRPPSPTIASGAVVLQRRIHEVALTGRLRVSEERALALLRSMCIGTVFTLLSEFEDRRDPGLSEAAREAFVAAITGAPNPRAEFGASAAASALRASLTQTNVLSAGERHHLEELLDRIADGGQGTGRP